MNLVHGISASLYDEEKEYTLNARVRDDKIIVICAIPILTLPIARPEK